MAKLGDFILHKKYLTIPQVQPTVPLTGRVAVEIPTERKNYISTFTPPLTTPPRGNPRGKVAETIFQPRQLSISAGVGTFSKNEVRLKTSFKNELDTQLSRKAEQLGVFPVSKINTQSIWDKIKPIFKPPILNQRFIDELRLQTQMAGIQNPSDFDVFMTGLSNIAGIAAILLTTGQIIANIANTIKTTNYLTSDLKNSINTLKQYSKETLNSNNLTDIYREGVRAVRPDLFVSSSLKPDMEGMAQLNVAYRYLESYASDMKVTGSFVSELFKTKLYFLTGIQLSIPGTSKVVNSVNNLIEVKNPCAISLYGKSPISITQLFNPNPKALTPALVNTLKNWAGYKLPNAEQLDFFKRMNTAPEVKEIAKPSEVVKPVMEIKKGQPYKTTLVYKGKTAFPTDYGVAGDRPSYITNKEVADAYGNGVSEQSLVKLNNGLILNGLSEYEEFKAPYLALDKDLSKTMPSKTERDKFVNQKIRKDLETQGYDGVVLRNVHYEGDEVIPYYPEKAISKVEPQPQKITHPVPTKEILYKTLGEEFKVLEKEAQQETSKEVEQPVTLTKQELQKNLNIINAHLMRQL